MTRSRTVGRLLLVFGVGLVGVGLEPGARAENPRPSTQAPATSAVPPPEIAVLNALRANPITAPYPIATSWRQGRVVLTGVVGTKAIHDAAIRLAIDRGYPVGDDLTIDTAAAHRVAAMSSAPAGGGSGMGMGMGLGASSYYVYPQPLFGRLDNPFYGFEPPLLSYPPWFRAAAAREPLSLSPANTLGPAVAPGQAMPGATGGGTPTSIPLGPNSRDGAIEMTLDPRGVAVLRGAVPSLADRVAIGQKIAQTPGVSEVINELTVAPMIASDVPPPPPQPAALPAPRRPPAPVPAPPPLQPGPRPEVPVDRNDLTARLEQTIANRPALAGQAVKVSVRDGVASLTGRVPTVYEAMLAFRAAQQTPGVHDVDDRLEFVVPDGVKKNPLIQKGRPEDVEPYLTSQIRRQVGDIAHVDQVRLRGETLEIRGTVRLEDDRPRLDAILRSMPVLRDFRLEPVFMRD